ncbi:hypothetical protein MD484_g3108, partial [Candolleomyces efflorescens]
MADLHFENFSGARNVHLGQQTVNIIAGDLNQYHSSRSAEHDLILRLNPISDASHTRNRATSPPDSACFPGTRRDAIRGITSWVDTRFVLGNRSAHICLFHGFAGSGKSAISLEIARIYARSGRLLGSFFFFSNAGDRRSMHRFAVTLASQLAAAVPAAAPFINGALRAEPGLLDEGASLATQLERLVYEPFQAAVKGWSLIKTLVKGPFLILIDGLDECEDKRGVEEFITHALDFFKRNPSIPLRIFIASRIEQHIHAHLKTEGVLVKDLNDHSPDADILKFLEASFQIAAKQNPIVQAYIHEHGSWPTKSDMDKLTKHIGGSFILASTIFKFIVQPLTEEDPTTPMDRLPLALEMNGLDSLYTQTLCRSQHLPHFREIISTIALIRSPRPIVEISHMLGIKAFEVIRVLVNLQAVIRVPGTDEEGVVTLCHTSLREFLSNKRRSGALFVLPSFHLHLASYFFSGMIKRTDRDAFDDLSTKDFEHHWVSFATLDGGDFISEVEQFKACQTLHEGRMPYYAFLCTMTFSTFFLSNLHWGLENPYLLAECAKQLALAAEYPAPLTLRWLEDNRMLWVEEIQTCMIQFTEDMCRTVQLELERAEKAIRINFPEFLGVLDSPSREWVAGTSSIVRSSISGISIFKAIQWIVARAQYKWEEMEITPRTSLQLSIRLDPSSDSINFTFE